MCYYCAGGALGDEGSITRLGQGKHWSTKPGGQHDVGATTSPRHRPGMCVEGQMLCTARMVYKILLKVLIFTCS